MTTRMRSTLAGVLLVALLASGCVWSFETLDGQGAGPHGRTGNNVGEYTTAVMYNGRPHVFYHDVTDGALRHAYWNGSFWSFETLDGLGGSNGRTANDVGSYNAAILSGGRPHVFYNDNDDGRLRHAYFTGTAWGFEILDGAGGSHGRTTNRVNEPSATIYNGRPHVFYVDEDAGNLRHGYWNGVFWDFEVLDGAGGPNGRIDNYAGEQSSVVIYNGRPHVFYHSDKNGMSGLLRHAYYNGSAWAFESLDGEGGANGRVVAHTGFDNAAVLYTTRPHVFYRDSSAGTLRHGYWNGVVWSFETLDATTDVGNGNSVFVEGSTIRVFHAKLSGSNELRQAHYNGSVWSNQTLDGVGGPGGRTTDSVGSDSSTIKDGTKIRVFYADSTIGGLRHAWFG